MKDIVTDNMKFKFNNLFLLLINFMYLFYRLEIYTKKLNGVNHGYLREANLLEKLTR